MRIVYGTQGDFLPEKDLVCVLIACYRALDASSVFETCGSDFTPHTT